VLATESDWLIPAILSEILGPTYLILMYFCQFEDKAISFDGSDPAMWSFILAGGYAGAGLLGKPSSGAVMNPAIAFGVDIVGLIDGKNIKWIWLHCALPFVGTFLGILLYKVFFAKLERPHKAVFSK
jgi:glycerol uptake facilitator-like aquaporin